jgi:hypothetical protein
VARQEEGPVYRGALAPAIVGTQYNEVKGVANAAEIVFFDLSRLAGTGRREVE